MREGLLVIAHTVEVQAVQNMATAQVRVQLEGAVKFPSSGGPVPFTVVGAREQCMCFCQRVVNGERPLSKPLRIRDGFRGGSVSVFVEDLEILCGTHVGQSIVAVFLNGLLKKVVCLVESLRCALIPVVAAL